MGVRVRRRSFLVSGLGGLAGLAAPRGIVGADVAVPPPPGRIEFSIERNGSAIGFHRVGFTRVGLDAVADTEINVRFEFGPITLYSYDHLSRETWRDGYLVEMHARTDDNGAETRFVARAADDGLIVKGDDGEHVLPADTLPTNYWVKITAARELWLHNQTGQPVRFDVRPRGIEPVAVDGGEVPAERFTLTGGLEADVWYHRDAWVKLALEAPDGSAITYRLRTPPPF